MVLSSKEVTKQVISFGVGLAALAVLLAVVVRAVRHRGDLMLTAADFLVQFGDLFDGRLGDSAYRRGLTAMRKGKLATARFWFGLERKLSAVFYPIFRIAWKLEGWALGQFHYNPNGYGLSAASPYRRYDDEDDLDYEDYLDDTPSYDDYRYDY